MKKLIPLLLLLVLSSENTIAQQMTGIMPLRERAKLEDNVLQERLDKLLPELMRREGIDMWVIIAREYNEDPIARTMLPATWLAARRRTIMLFTDQGPEKGLEKLAVARYDIGKLMKGAWKPEEEPNQWKRLAELISERNPKKIGLNISPQFAHADGLTKAEYDSLMHYLPAAFKKKVVSAEQLAVNWLQIRTPTELELYEQISRIGHRIIAEGFSEKVVKPGVTTTDDVVWWYRERIAELKLTAWFHPTVDLQRANPGSGDSQRSFSQRPEVEVIMPGDLLHVDLGITYLGLNTDVQQLAYVLKPGEKKAPDYLKKALNTGNRLQDILTSKFEAGKSGNQVLKETLAQAQKENITPSIYSHPIGYHGHGAGPAIGMWDQQQGVPGTGDYLLQYNTVYAIELNAKVVLPEWNNKEIRVMLEEQAVFTPNGVRYIDGRQKELLLIPRSKTQ
ncbi:Xaa-Pro aminopeptidase [Pontibacter aydingkolensis]|uniref:M24 family metallopeptidase n=1 Tax=Pontibacter aydingkolensis TaxID=1911536 RepID=A0ABS7CYB8_9BACT|nr:M24 family metallopeptidase [Pontibacter aydingkolensis]MBW7468676.1 M24 family metallopeptidase [Pontibacter aydingkolensis]